MSRPGSRQPSGSPPQPTGIGAETVAVLQAALHAEHAAVWSYGVAGAFVTAEVIPALNEGSAAHRARRDTVERLLQDAGVEPVPSEPAYQVPEPVFDAPSAMRLLVTAETDVAQAWRATVERTRNEDVRATAMAGLTDAAVRAARWRVAAAIAPATVPFPGQQD